LDFSDLKAVFVNTTVRAGACAHDNLPEAREAGKWYNYREDQPL
jgi:hypothetical protein